MPLKKVTPKKVVQNKNELKKKVRKKKQIVQTKIVPKKKQIGGVMHSGIFFYIHIFDLVFDFYNQTHSKI